MGAMPTRNLARQPKRRSPSVSAVAEYEDPTTRRTLDEMRRLSRELMDRNGREFMSSDAADAQDAFHYLLFAVGGEAYGRESAFAGYSFTESPKTPAARIRHAESANEYLRKLGLKSRVSLKSRADTRRTGMAAIKELVQWCGRRRVDPDHGLQH
jgi:hypothetical protein